MKPKLYLINGALGAGKTTILTQLIKTPSFKNARIIENEFANTSIDTEQFHDHDARIETIAGLCICCSTGDELDDALRRLADAGNEPVVVEATGMANSLKLIEKLVVSGVLTRYHLASAIFVIDAAAVAGDSERLLSQYSDEIKAADIVVITKADLLDKATTKAIEDMLVRCGAKKSVSATMGHFDESAITDQSTILDYYVDHAEGLQNHDSAMNYTVIDTADIAMDEHALEARWNALRQTYQLLRMKGDIVTKNGSFHVEATPEQCIVEPSTTRNTKLVFIGKDARTMTRDVLEEVL